VILINILGEKIRKIRKEKGLTLERLAEITESSKSYIWELENNKNPPRPSAEKLARIAEHLETTIEYLLDEGEELAEDAADKNFYRQYRKMPAETKEKIRKMVKLWGDGE
jgi:transcriptional regulator with XRE-family HTH domain